MVDISQRLEPDQLAFYFTSKHGVEASDLANFLLRADTIARKKHVSLQVVAIENGSLAVIVRAIFDPLYREFQKSPIQTTAAAIVISTYVASAVSASVTNSPFAKSAAKIVEHSDVVRIEIITREERFLIMDDRRAEQLRHENRHTSEVSRTSTVEPHYAVDTVKAEDSETGKHSRVVQIPAIRQIERATEEGSLQGVVLPIDGHLHFRPDGYRFTVPIMISGHTNISPNAGEHVRIRGELKTLNGQPDSIVVYEMVQLQ